MNFETRKLKEKKLKITPQRLAIFNYLLNTTSHPKVETIYNDLKEEYPSMSIATVYKTLNSLKNVNLVREFSSGEESLRYDGNTDFHTHLICEECKNVYDYIDDEAISNVEKEILNKTNFKINYKQLCFFGICDKCKNK